MPTEHGGAAVDRVRRQADLYELARTWLPSVSSLKEWGRVIPEGVGPCQWGFCGGLAGGWACVTRVSCFPDSCGVRGERAGGSRTGAEPGRPGRAAPEASLRRPPGSPMMGQRGTGAPRGVRAYSVAVRSVPCSGSRGAGSAAGCSHPFACPRPEPGIAWGGSASGRDAVRRGQSRGRPRRRVTVAGQTQRRPRAWPLARGRLFMPPAGLRGSWTGSGSARRAGRRTPG